MAVIPLRSTTCDCAEIKNHGLPETVVSDNDTQFTSQKFKMFMKENGIYHVASSPRYQRNGRESCSNIQELS